jgi:hypothetical protein
MNMDVSGRPLVQPPRGRDMTTSSTARDRTPSIPYREGGRRLSERLEARAVRVAMEEMDLKSEQNLYEAARDEAADLVYKHINPDAPGVNPNAPYPYPISSERSRSLPREDQDLQRANSKLRKRHSMGSTTAGSRSSSAQRSSSGQSRRSGSGSSVTASTPFTTVPEDKAEESSVLPKASSFGTGSEQRRRSSGSRRKMSASLFKNPNDQIYEEPEEEQKAKATSAPASEPAPAPAIANPPAPSKVPLGTRRNPFARVRDNNMVRSNTDPILATKRLDRFEIQRNPPSQSRNAAYTKNSDPPRTSEDGKSDAENTEIKMKDGKEVRSDELRAATGFSLKNRSPKLPTPSMVSDSPGRPIVSFKNDWKPKEIELKQEISSLPGLNPRPLNSTSQRPFSKAVTDSVVPTMNALEEGPRKVNAPHPSPFPRARAFPLPSVASTSSTKVTPGKLPTISVFEDPQTRPLPNASTSRKVNTPQPASPTVPTINVFQAPSSRTKPSSVPPIPTISVQEPTSISFSASRRGSGVNAPSISVTPSIPTISVGETPAPTRGPKIHAPSISVTPSVPTISINESPAPNRGLPKIAAPSISVTPSVPTINVNVNGTGSTRPLPDPKTASKSFGARPTPPTRPRSHWTPSSVRTGALCEQCALPIAGRIVSAGGSRFHPECFACHHCGEHLECVAFYPEPDSNRSARVARIRARLAGDDIEFLPSHPTMLDMQRLEAEDAHDESLRFYCHLDFHELFSPRCKSCKTPIEGEVVVACGAEWHPGHFFCAQCGDPFDSSTPFVEKEGYAWCVGCHTNRYSTKCRKCKRSVTETVVKALGWEWHVGCFCCVVSFTCPRVVCV